MTRQRRLRLLMVADSYWPVVGGGETHSRLLARTLAAKGVDITILTQHRLAESPVFEKLDDIPVHRVGKAGYKRFGKYLMVPAMIRWLLRHREEFDTVYVCGLRILGLPVVLLGRQLQIPVVLRSESCEELSGMHIKEHLLGIKKLMLPMAMCLVSARNSVLRKADKFLAISDIIADEFSSCGVRPEKVVKIYNGIDLTVYTTNISAASRQALRDKLELPKDKILVVYTGKLNRGKGIEYLLQAWTTLVASNTKLHLVLVGSGEHMYLSMEDTLRTFVSDHALTESVTFTGYTDRVVDYLHAADLYVMPSEMEALCISLIEALACGLPSVATNVGGIPDVARHEHEALLVPPADASAIVTAIQRLLDETDLTARISKNGTDRVIQLFDINRVADQHISLFTELSLKSLTARKR